MNLYIGVYGMQNLVLLMQIDAVSLRLLMQILGVSFVFLSLPASVGRIDPSQGYGSRVTDPWTSNG